MLEKAEVAVVGIDIGKNSFHVVGLSARGEVVLRQKWSRSQVEVRLANMPPCLIGMEACVGAHHLSRRLKALGHEARLMPAKYVRPYSKGQKNDFRDAEAIAEAVQRPTMKFVATKTVEQLDLQALHRVRERMVSQRTGIINQIRAFLLERGIAVRQGQCFLRAELPDILAARSGADASGFYPEQFLCISEGNFLLGFTWQIDCPKPVGSFLHVHKRVVGCEHHAIHTDVLQ